MPTQEQEWNAPVTAEFRANAGEVAAPYDNPPPMLLLPTIAARSGRVHIVPLRARLEDGARYVFGSAHGSERHPAWHRNVVANPEYLIEKGPETVPVHATEVTGAERERVFRAHATQFPTFVDHEQKLERTIPVLKLERRG
ncbi:MAG: nitroreductase/quinone reductase family protein [Thermomicrobiales bacterium]|nr:nitroreductase family deazaflavin-dependent oxidoreductase [Thermomicrobiales bacterium]